MLPKRNILIGGGTVVVLAICAGIAYGWLLGSAQAVADCFKSPTGTMQAKIVGVVPNLDPSRDIDVVMSTPEGDSTKTTIPHRQVDNPETPDVNESTLNSTPVVVYTSKASINPGTATFTITWTNGKPGSEVRTAPYGNIGCQPETPNTGGSTTNTPPPPSDNTTTTVPNDVVVGNPTPVKTPVKTPSVPTTGKVNKDLPGRTHPGRLYRMKITIHNNGKKPVTYTAIDRLPKGMLGVVRQADGSFRTTNVLTTKVTLRPGGTYVWRPLFTMTPAAMYNWVTNTVILRIGTRVVDTAQAKTYDPPIPGTPVTYIK